MNFLEAPAPREALSAADMQRGLEQPPGFSDYLRANAAEGFWSSGLGQVAAGIRVERAATIGTLDPAENAPLAEADWKSSEFHRPGIAYRPDMTRATARALAEIKDENDARRRLIGARDAGLGEMALGFGAAMVGGLATPENFIPFAGPALNAARAGRFGAYLARLGTAAETAAAGGVGARAAVGAGMGATDAFLGNLLAMPLVHGSRQDFGDDITWADVVQDLALGAVGGGVLGGAVHAGLGARTAGPGNRPATPLPAETQDAALRGLTGAAAQVANGENVNLSAADAALRAELATLRAADAERRAAMSVSGQAAARELVPSGRVAPGAETRATTPAGTDVAVRYEVVEAADLVASHRLPDFTGNPAFAGELQPRDRSTAERQAQVRGIAARLRPEELEASPSTTTGAPIVGPDGLVESGNGRVLAIATAYQNGLPTAQSYRAMLEQFGFDQAANMREPVLIRRRVSELDPAARVRFTNESNLASIDALTPGEQARVDAQAITPQVLALVRAQDLTAAANADMQRAFIAGLAGREQRALSRDGALTPDGITRLRRAMAARAYDDAALITRLTETADGAAEAIGRGLLDAAPSMAALRAAREAGQLRPELDATQALVRAVQRIQQVRDANLPIRSALDQLDLFGGDAGPAERAFLDLLLRHPNRQQLGGVGRDTIAERLAAYARHAREAPNEPDMFGTAPPGLGDVLAATFRDAGLEPPPALRTLRADAYSPPEPTAPAPTPEAPRTEATPVARAAEQAGLDVDVGAARADVQRLVKAGRLPDELAAEIRAADELVAQTETAPDAWQAAVSCALGR